MFEDCRSRQLVIAWPGLIWVREAEQGTADSGHAAVRDVFPCCPRRKESISMARQFVLNVKVPLLHVGPDRLVGIE